MQQRVEDGLSSARLDHSYFEDEVRPYLGAVLLKSRLLEPQQLDEALGEQARTRKRLGQILLERGWIFPPELARALAEQQGLEYVDIQYSSVDIRAAALLNPEIGQRHCAIPIRFLSNGSVLVAVADPTSDGLGQIAAALGQPVVFAVAEDSDIRNAWRALLSGYRP